MCEKIPHSTLPRGSTSTDPCLGSVDHPKRETNDEYGEGRRGENVDETKSVNQNTSKRVRSVLRCG